MPAIALAEALPDFGPASKAHSHTGFEDAGTEHVGPGIQPHDAASALEERVAAAETALRTSLAAEHEAALAAERELHAVQLHTLQEELGEKTGALIAQKVAELEGHLVELTSSVTARILGIALTEDLQRRAIAALATTITEVLADREALRIGVRGAPHMFEALKGALGARADHLDFSESGDLDLTLSIDDKLYETRLAEWSAALAGVLG